MENQGDESKKLTTQLLVLHMMLFFALLHNVKPGDLNVFTHSIEFSSKELLRKKFLNVLEISGKLGEFSFSKSVCMHSIFSILS